MAALMVPQVLSIMHATFPAHERGKVFGMFGAVVGLGAVSRPAARRAAHRVEPLRSGMAPDLPDQPAGRHRGPDPAAAGSSPSPRPRAPCKLDLVGVALVTARPADAALPAHPGPRAGLAAVGVRLDGRRARSSSRRSWRYERQQGAQGRLAARRALAVQGEELRGGHRRAAGLRRRARHLLPGLDAVHADWASAGARCRPG